MESVRKGKGLKPQWEEEMTAHGVPDWYIWSCKKIKYMFPKAHAAAYVMMAYRIAWYKDLRAPGLLRGLLFHPGLGFQLRAHVHGPGAAGILYGRVPEALGTPLSKKEQDTYKDMKIVQEMYARGYDFLPVDLYQAKAHRFQILDGKLMPALDTIEGLGDKAADAVVLAARDGKIPLQGRFPQPHQSQRHRHRSHERPGNFRRPATVQPDFTV